MLNKFLYPVSFQISAYLKVFYAINDLKKYRIINLLSFHLAQLRQDLGAD